ncbi:MAG: hypothetical protein AAF721_12150, partial [Myxococcota bacterium]
MSDHEFSDDPVEYLWDGSGAPDPAVEHFERWAGQFGLAAAAGRSRRSGPARRRRAGVAVVRPSRRTAPTPRRAPYGVAALAAAAAVLLVVAWLPPAGHGDGA